MWEDEDLGARLLPAQEVAVRTCDTSANPAVCLRSWGAAAFSQTPSLPLASQICFRSDGKCMS